MHLPATPRGVLAVLALAAGIASAPLHAQVFFTETFEAPTWTVGQKLTGTAFDGWIGNDNTPSPGSNIVQASTVTAAEGTQSLFIRDNGSSTPFAQTDWGTNIGTSITGPGYFEFSFRNASAAGNPTTTGNYAVTFINTGANARNFGFTFSDTAGFRLINDAGAALKTVSYAAAGYTPGDWVTFRIDFDEVANTAGVSLNGSSIAGLSVLAGEADAVLWQAGRIQLTAGFSSGYAAGYFDDFTAAVSVPEPSSAAAVLGAFGLLMAVGGRRVRTARGV